MSTSAGADRRSPGQVDSGGKDSAEEVPRVKRWAPRSRTGCLGCRARRVKCDEIRPKCKSCQKRNMECRYELNPPGADSSSNALPKPSISIRPKPAATGQHDNSAGSVKRDESPRACRRCPCSGLLSPEPEAPCRAGEPAYHATASTVTGSSGRRWPSSASRALSMRCQRRTPDSRVQEAALVADIHPPDWYYSEAVTYFNTYLLGKIKKFEVIPINYHRPLGKNVANFDAFIAFILAHRITEISRDRGSPAQPSEAYRTKHLWERLYTCISNQITCINNEIARPNSGDAARVRVLTRIQGIKCVELMLQTPIWRNHMEGFLSLLRYCGGLKFAQGREALIRSIKGMVMESVLANSVSPASDQIVGTSYFTAEELLFFHNQILHPNFPCPGVLFARILETNNLRVQMHSNPSLGYFTDALIILQRIDAFQPTAWKESAYTLPQIPEVPLMASIYQLSVGLFCLMALQYAGLGSMDKAERRSSLLGLLRTAWSLEHCRDALNWPLAVVGCALADGGTPAERAFVCNCLQDAAQHVFAVHPLPIMSKLEQFWASGMTHWDKCWGEPFPIVG